MGNTNVLRVRAKRTSKIKNLVDGQIAGYVLKLDPESLKDLIEEFQGGDYVEHGATVFVNIYENESKFNDGPKTFLSTTLGIEPNFPLDDTSKVASNRSQISKDAEKAFGSRGSGRGNGSSRVRS